MTKYKNVSLSKETYAILDKLSKVLVPDFPGGKLSISKTIQYIAKEKVKKLNGKFKKS